MGYLIKMVAIRRKPICKSQGGVAMVEFLISVPFLLLMFAAIVEFGIMFYQQTTLNKSVQDGARYLAGKSVFGSVGFTEIRAQQRVEVSNLVVYGNILGTGQPLIDGLDTSMVTIECAYGSTATSSGTRCNSDAVINLLSPFSVSAQVQYSPVLGGMLTSFTGLNISIPLKASTVSVGF